MRFQMLDDVERYLRFGRFPKGDCKTKKFTLRRFSKKFCWQDNALWYMDGSTRQRKVLRNEEEVRAVLIEYHDNQGHSGRKKCIKAVSDLFYWRSVTKDVMQWIDNCQTCCQVVRKVAKMPGWSQHCFAHGCESSCGPYHNEDGITFHRFPFGEPGRLNLWVQITHRDHWSLSTKSVLCSKHFTEDCFDRTGETVCLKPYTVPTIEVSTHAQEICTEAQGDPCMFSEDHCSSSNDEVVHFEHPYAMDSVELKMKLGKRVKKASRVSKTEPCFTRYDAVEKYLSTGMYAKELPLKTQKYTLRRCAKRFCLKDGVLYYCQGTKRRRVVRSREDVNSILSEHHDNQGHYGLKRSLTAVHELYYWGNMTKDMEDWIGNCKSCLTMDQSTQKYRCTAYSCSNYNGPVERSLGLTFHRFPVDKPDRLSQWITNMQRGDWFPTPRSVVCSSHFTEDSVDRSGGIVRLKPNAVPTLLLCRPPQKKPQNRDTENGYTPHGYTNNSQPCVPLHNMREANTQHTFFAKYDAVEKYLSVGVYPPGLTSVEKNTLRRLCKRFSVQDGFLFYTSGRTKVKHGRRRVVRSKEEVHATLTVYHDDMNHLDMDKCLKLISRHFFWGSMKADVAQYIQSCRECLNVMERAPISPRDVCASPGSSIGSGDPGAMENQEPFSPEFSCPTGEDLPAEHSTVQSLAQQVLQQCMSSSTAEMRAGSKNTKSHQPHRNMNDGRGGTPKQNTLKSSSKGPLNEDLPVDRRSGLLSARTVIQQCQHAILQVRPPVGDSDTEWVEVLCSQSYTELTITLTPAPNRIRDARLIPENFIGASIISTSNAIQGGMVIYVYFFKGATEQIISKMVNSLLNAKFFQLDSGKHTSVIDLPGSVLIVPQDTLTGTINGRKVEYHDSIEVWKGHRLYTNFVSQCEKELASSKKCTEAGVVVKHGVYGNKQVLYLNTNGPLTHVIEF